MFTWSHVFTVLIDNVIEEGVQFIIIQKTFISAFCREPAGKVRPQVQMVTLSFAQNDSVTTFEYLTAAGEDSQYVVKS